MGSLLCWGGGGRWACEGVLGCASGQRGQSATAVFVWKSHTARNIPERLRNRTSFSVRSLAFLFSDSLLGHSCGASNICSWSGVGSSGQRKTNTYPPSLSHTPTERTQQRSECGHSPGASAPTTTLLCHALLLPDIAVALILFQPMFSQTGSSVFSIWPSLLGHTFSNLFNTW